MSGHGGVWRGVEVRVSSQFGWRAGGAEAGVRPAGAAGGWRIQIRGPADTDSRPELVSTCAGYSFGYECVAGPGPSRYTFGARTCSDLRGIQVRVRMCGSGPRPLAPAARDTDSSPERVSTCAGYSFVYECVAAGQQRARRESAMRVSGPHLPRYKPYLATACRMRAPHGTQIAARKPTVAAPCRQSHGRPAAYAATMAGQVMGST